MQQMTTGRNRTGGAQNLHFSEIEVEVRVRLWVLLNRDGEEDSMPQTSADSRKCYDSTIPKGPNTHPRLKPTASCFYPTTPLPLSSEPFGRKVAI